MNAWSEQLAQLIVKERSENIQRRYEHRRLVRITREGQQNSFRQWLRDVIQRVRGTGSPHTVIEPSENVLYMSEVFGLSPDELRRKEARRLLYERIARGNALAEIEGHDRRPRPGKA